MAWSPTRLLVCLQLDQEKLFVEKVSTLTKVNQSAESTVGLGLHI